jgi:formate hydrogenlyase subunit 4
VALTENCRIPVDDPNTHLELTMIHEVMVLDHSGPDFGMILYAAALKLWFFLALLSGLLIPVRSENLWINGISTIIGIFFLAVGVGLVESVMARLRLLRIPQLLAGALSLSALALVLVLWG